MTASAWRQPPWALLAAAAEAAPLLVVVDDLPWLDQESAEALLFAARRLRHDRVAFLLTRREGAETRPLVEDADQLRLGGLSAAEAAVLLGPRHRSGGGRAPGHRHRRQPARPAGMRTLAHAGAAGGGGGAADRPAGPRPAPGDLRTRAVGPPGRRVDGGPAGRGEPRPGAGSGGRRPRRPRPGHRPVPGGGGRGAGARRTGARLPASAAAVRRVAPGRGCRATAGPCRPRGRSAGRGGADLAPGRGRLRLRPGAGPRAGGDRTVRGGPARVRGGLGGVRAGGPADARAGRGRGAARAGGGKCPPGRRRRTRAAVGRGGPGRSGGGRGPRQCPVRPRAAGGVHRNVRPRA